MRNTCLLFRASFFVVATSLGAATFTSSATCQLGSVSISSSSSCDPGVIDSGIARASVSLNVELGTSGFSFSGGGMVQAMAGQIAEPPLLQNVPANVTADASYEVSLFLPGSGSGYMVQTFSGGTDGDNAHFSLTISAPGGGIRCGLQVCIPSANVSVIPVTLGQVDTFGFVISGSASNNELMENLALLSFSGSFSFLEADGKTPVLISDVSDAPEPTTWGLVMLGAAAMAALKARRGALLAKDKV